MKKTKLWLAVGFLTAFGLWTAAVGLVDVDAIGPQSSAVGFAALNSSFHRLTGVNWTLYTLTDWLGLAPLAVAAGFGALGLCQWIRRKSLLSIDRSLLILGGFYLAVLAVYVLFEKLVINHRPVLIAGVLEASYPSSTTMLAICVMPTAMLQLRQRIRNQVLRRWLLGAMAVFTVFMVVGRLISGVHWLTDIIGGILLSAGLVMLYAAAETDTGKNKT